jgi:hypothetical protein
VARNAATIQGLETLRRRLDALPELIEKAARQAVQDETIAAAQDMRRNAPRLTGELRDGVQAELGDLDKLEGRAVSTAPHTTFVVHGTSDTPANDFITPAALRSERRFPKRVRDQVLAELRKITE